MIAHNIVFHADGAGGDPVVRSRGNTQKPHQKIMEIKALVQAVLPQHRPVQLPQSLPEGRVLPQKDIGMEKCRVQFLPKRGHRIKGIFTDVHLDGLFCLDGTIFALGLNGRNMFVLFIAVLILFAVSCLQESGMKMRETIAKQNLLFRWMLYVGCIAVILIFGIYGPEFSTSEFIYQAF